MGKINSSKYVWTILQYPPIATDSLSQKQPELLNFRYFSFLTESLDSFLLRKTCLLLHYRINIEGGF